MLGPGPYRKTMPPAGAHERADVAGWTDEFVDVVFPAEYRTIMDRRREVARRATDTEPATTPANEQSEGQVIEPPDRSEGGPLVPSVKLRLFGLAFSGGGVRSSTFNLGLAQALAKKGLLPRFDYLSTVSGGGYIGACLSSLLHRPDADTRWTREFPLYMESGRQEPIGLRHLRNHGQHLLTAATQGVFGMAAVSIRGILLNLLALLPWVILMVGLTHLAYGEQLVGGLRAGLPSFALTWIALTGLGLAVVLFPFGAWLAHRRETTIEARRRAGALYAVLLELTLGLAVLESLPLVLRWYHQGSVGALLSGLAGLSLLAPMLCAGTPSDGDKGLVPRLQAALAVVAVVTAAPLLLVLGYVVLGEWVVFPATSPFDPSLVPWVVYGSGAVVLAYMVLLLDPNTTSVHRFYRDRLSLPYLFEVEGSGSGSGLGSKRIRSADRLRLSELNPPGTVAPYHLVNATLNLQSSTDVGLRGRMADFFVFSKHHTGGTRTGYCATSVMETADPHLDLGTAMAISGAAVSPIMGTYSIPSVALLVTLLNLRMGYWLIHPRHAARAPSGLARGLANLGVGLGQLLSEARSRADEHGRFINVSDGGHLENLGVYELLRRRCRVIVCGDGEADPNLEYASLATLLRFAATDMGVHIDIDLSGLRPNANGRSRQHHAIGRIDYGDGEVGWLLYVKLSIGERELPYIEQYRSANPDFPHQSTADQFFDEAQLEAYRALGFKVGLRALGALEALQQEADDDELLAFGPPGAVSGTTDAEGDLVDTRLARGFGSATDPDPPW